jgi:DNA-directed RNA polymerase specialized sigma24 family protein
MTSVHALTFPMEAVRFSAVGRRTRETETADVFRAVRSGDPNGAERLFALLHEGIRFFLARSLGDDAVAAIEDVFSVVLQAIQQGELRDPDALTGFTLGVVKSHLSLLSQEPIRRVKGASGAAEPEDVEAMRLVLQELPERERETLVRFYLDGQPCSQVLREMELTPGEFVAIKSRAKARFVEFRVARIPRKPVGSVKPVPAAVALW